VIPDLVFTLLMVKDGYSAIYEKKVDPTAGRGLTTVLKVCTPISDPSEMVKGKVVDGRSNPVRDVLVGCQRRRRTNAHAQRPPRQAASFLSGSRSMSASI
jgi:hypothetical protein